MPGPARKSQTPPTPEAVPWLEEEEAVAWRFLASMLVKLPWALECQLKHDSGLSFIEYHALARLSEDPKHTLRMSVLAGLTNSSLPRLSYLIQRLENRGYVRRKADPSDGRFTNAILTKRGYAKLVDSAPGHVAAVRELVIDCFTPAELKRLGKDAERLLQRIHARALRAGVQESEGSPGSVGRHSCADEFD